MEDIFGLEKKDVGAIQALRQALAQPEKKGHCVCGQPEALGVVHSRTKPCFHYTAPVDAAIVAEVGIWGEKPWVKTYCGGVPNYCTPVDAVNMTPEPVDETAKREHEPVGYIDGMYGGYMVFTPLNPSAVYLNGTALYTAPPKREWVGLTVNEAQKFYEKYTDREELIYAIDKFLEEKNGG